LPTTLHKRDHRPARSLRIAVTAPSYPCYPCTTSRFRMQMTLRRGTQHRPHANAWCALPASAERRLFRRRGTPCPASRASFNCTPPTIPSFHANCSIIIPSDWLGVVASTHHTPSILLLSGRVQTNSSACTELATSTRQKHLGPTPAPLLQTDRHTTETISSRIRTETIPSRIRAANFHFHFWNTSM
jgi:hypothetical protein